VRTLSKSDVNVAGRDGITPLMYAATVGSLEAMKILLDAGADVNARNTMKQTALMLSVTELDKVRVLVEHGANVNAVSSRGRSGSAAVVGISSRSRKRAAEDVAETKLTEAGDVTGFRRPTLEASSAGHCQVVRAIRVQRKNAP
jgi:ankyrin repeat protein